MCLGFRRGLTLSSLMLVCLQSDLHCTLAVRRLAVRRTATVLGSVHRDVEVQGAHSPGAAAACLCSKSSSLLLLWHCILSPSLLLPMTTGSLPENVHRVDKKAR
jgi:uncharacterized membrane protein